MKHYLLILLAAVACLIGFTPATASAQTEVTARRLCHRVWIPGHWRYYRYHHRVWIPGHWAY